MEDWGLEFYFGDEFRGKDRKERCVTRIDIFNEKDKALFLSEKGLKDKELMAAFDDLVEQCIEISKDNKLSFADFYVRLQSIIKKKKHLLLMMLKNVIVNSIP